MNKVNPVSSLANSSMLANTLILFVFIIFTAIHYNAYAESESLNQITEENNPCYNDTENGEYLLNYNAPNKIHKKKKVPIKPAPKKKPVVKHHPKKKPIIVKKKPTNITPSENKPQFKENFTDNVMALDCLPTPAVWDETPQPEIYMGNNLWRSVGSAEFANGEYIEVMGRVLDSRCVPVNNALVEIWQLDNNGYDVNYYGLEYKTDEEISEERKSLLTNKLNKNFIGSGSINTDNLGYYRFYTIMPGQAKSDRMPHINFNIQHRNFTNLRTEMYFPITQYSINKDKLISETIENHMQKKLLIATNIANNKKVGPGIPVRVYRFDIVLEGSDPYKEY